MSLGALVFATFVDAAMPGPRMVSCTFPATEPDTRTIRVAVEARPSLMDVAHRFRILLHLGDEREVGGLAQPIDRTAERDVLIRAKASEELIYTIGLRDDGHAALNLLRVGAATDAARMETRAGACAGNMALVKTWLRS